ncbi:MAG: AAA family ATPase, partial [Acidobacteriota bacterium]
DKPESWLPDAPWTGVVLTRALASVTQAPTRAIEGSELRALADAQAPVELVGRDARLTDLAADCAAGLARGPGFALLVGDAGVGKTAFAGELARRLGELGTRVVLASVPAPGTGKPPHAALAELIDTPAPGMSVVRWVGDALRAVARRQPLAVILDDLHLADHDLLDALEYATLGGEVLPLWILGVASPRLDVRRPQLGHRAERHRRDVLPPLDEDAAVALAAALLRPAEYPPLRALRRLAAIAHGNPLHLALLAREIHERGAVRARPGGAPFLDTTALDDLQPVALGPWLAARELAQLAPEQVALARVCAVLGGELARDGLGAIVDAVERRGGATTTIDVDIGLGELVRAGLLVEHAGRYRFRQSLVEEGIYATTDERERLALHEAALAHWRGGDAFERIARHAEAVGARELAAEAYAQLGARAHAEQRMLDADQEWTGAVRNLEAKGSARGRALLGRARARYGQQRVKEALADLDEALACADAAGDAGLEIDALLERATVLDWADDYAASAATTARARERLVAAPSDDRALELQLAAGREAFRRAQQGSGGYEDAIEPLRAAIAQARALGRGDVAAIAGVLLGPALAWMHDASAEAVFGEVIASCEARDDRLHLGAAFANRAWLWNASGELDRFVADMRRCIQLSREIGQASLERIGTYNLAENLLWQAKLDEALALARRCVAIQQAHGEGSTQPDRLLLGRVLAARDDRGELAQVLETFAGEPLAGEDEAVVASLRAVIDRTAWPAALAAADALAPQVRIELALLARRAGTLDPARRATLGKLAAEHAIWRRRASEL